MRDVPKHFLIFIASAIAISIYLIWSGLNREGPKGAVIAIGGVVGLLCFLALIVAIMVRSRRK